MLGLVVEAVSRLSYQQYVQEKIIKPCELERTGFYRLDSLPSNSAYGYVQDDDTGQWRANVFCMPVIGGSDGGLFTCAGDLAKLWRAVFSHEILSEEMTQSFLKPQVKMRSDPEHRGYYGLGVYINNNEDGSSTYYAVGGDFGVEFFTAYFPKQKIVASALANTEVRLFSLLRALLQSTCAIG